MSKKSEQINRKFIESFAVDEWEVLTDTGWRDISSTNKTIEYEVFEVKTSTGRTLKCADDHILFTSDLEEIFAKDSLGKDVATESGVERVVSVVSLGYSEEMYDLSVDSDDHRYYTNGFLSHNTTCVAAFFVWYITFNSNKTCAILANKAATAREILSRVQKAFEYLPKWLQHGVVEWNKGSFELENGSRILAASTSSSAIRGFSINCVTGDTIVTLLDNDVEYSTTIEKAFLNEDKRKLQILTSKGFRDFDGFVCNGIKPVGDLSFEGKTLSCTPEHRILINDEWVEATNIEGYSVDREEAVYDAINVDDGSEYLTNGISSHNCLLLDEFAFVPNNIADEFFASVYPTIASSKESKLAMVSTPNGLNHFYKFYKEAEAGINGFNLTKAIWSDVPGRDQAWADQQRKILGDVKFSQEMECKFQGGSNTLIAGEKLASLPVERPIALSDTLKIYEEPDKTKSYVMTVDTARGLGGDYSAFVIFDVSQLPYRVVAVFRDNKISPLLYPGLILKMATQYNQAAVLIENNDMGESISNSLYFDYEYEMVIKSHENVISSFGGRTPGFKTTKKSKSLGCSTLKTLIEDDKLDIRDSDIIYELSNFVAKGSSFEADVGNDDLAMCLVMFSYMTIQPAMEDFTSVSAKNQILIERMKMAEEEMMPVGGFTDGTEQELDVMNF